MFASFEKEKKKPPPCSIFSDIKSKKAVEKREASETKKENGW